jgi:hypothetical protein
VKARVAVGSALAVAVVADAVAAAVAAEVVARVAAVAVVEATRATRLRAPAAVAGVTLLPGRDRASNNRVPLERIRPKAHAPKRAVTVAPRCRAQHHLSGKSGSRWATNINR